MQNTFFKIPEYGLIKISGKDAKSFLQGQLTCNMDKLSDNKTVLTAHCSAQGFILSLFYVFFLPSEANYFLFLPKNMITATIHNLKKYAIFSQVTITETLEYNVLVYNKNAMVAANLASSYDLLFASAYNFLLTTSPLINTEIDTENMWHKHNILHKIPMIYPQTANAIRPHDIGLPQLQGVDFDKGCYIGQEIIARMHYKGRLKNHLYLGEIAHAPALPGENIYTYDNGKEKIKGIIIDSYSNGNQTHILFITDEQSIHLDLKINAFSESICQKK